MENFGCGPRRACALVVCMAASACSPYVYSGPIGQFSSATHSLSSSYSATAQNISNEQTLLQRTDWLVSRPRLKGPGCDVVAPKMPPCALEVDTAPRRPGGGVMPAVPPAPAAPAPSKLKVEDVFKALDNYATALAALTNAADRAAFDAAASKASAAVASLASVAGPAGTAAGTVIKPVGNILFWLVGQKLDYDRLQTLRDTVTAADPSIQLLSAAALPTFLSGQNDTQQNVLLQLLASQIEKVNMLASGKSTSDADYGVAVDTAQATAAQFVAAHDADPKAAAAGLGQAHAKLLQAVMSNDGQWSALEASLTTFEGDVSALVKAANPASAAATAKSSGAK